MSEFQVLMRTDKAPDPALLAALASGSAVIRPEGDHWLISHHSSLRGVVRVYDLPRRVGNLCWHGTARSGAASAADALRVGRLAVEAVLDGYADRVPFPGGCTLHVTGGGDNGSDIVVDLHRVSYR